MTLEPGMSVRTLVDLLASDGTVIPIGTQRLLVSPSQPIVPIRLLHQS